MGTNNPESICGVKNCRWLYIHHDPVHGDADADCSGLHLRSDGLDWLLWHFEEKKLDALGRECQISKCSLIS